jgi:DNA-binding LacI/PurR family transcriptional regulator
MKDVAALASVSLWTVSNAFSHPERVASSTRERVLSAAASLGYAGPNPLARSLASGRTGVVALVAAGSAEPLLADPAAGLVARGLVHACDRAGVSVLFTGQADGAAVDGWVLLRDATIAPSLQGPVVAVDAPPVAGVIPVGADVGAGAAEAARHLAALGHRRLAVLSWPGAGERLEGARRGWGGAGPVEVFVAGTPEGFHGRPAGRAQEERAVGPVRGDGVEAARVVVGRAPRATAILALTDALAIGALEAVRWAGLRVPEDISIAGIDDLPESAGLQLTSVFVPYRPMGELAGAMLATLMESGDAAPPALMPTALTIRGTTGAPPV